MKLENNIQNGFIVKNREINSKNEFDDVLFL